MPPYEIVTTVPRVSPAKVDVNGRRERSLENGAALWVANSPLGSSAVRLGAAEITTHHRELVRVYVMRRSLVDVCLVPLADVEHLATPLVAIVHRDTRPSARAASATPHGEAAEVKLGGFSAPTQDVSGAFGSARNDTTTSCAQGEAGETKCPMPGMLMMVALAGLPPRPWPRRAT